MIWNRLQQLTAANWWAEFTSIQDGFAFDMMTSYMSRLLSVSLPDDLADEIEALAESSGRTKSELVRDAMRRQVALEGFAEVRRYGQDRAETLGIGPEDVERIVDEVRADRR